MFDQGTVIIDRYDAGVTEVERQRQVELNRLTTLLRSRLPRRLVCRWAQKYLPITSIELRPAPFPGWAEEVRLVYPDCVVDSTY